MTKHVENEDCPECRKVQELEPKLIAVLEQSDLAPDNKANSLLMLALVELLPHGVTGAKQKFDALKANLFRKLDANADVIFNTGE